MKQITLSLIIAGILSGCTSFPSDYEKEVGLPDIAEQMNDAWSSSPAIRYVDSSAGVTVRKYFELPSRVANRQLTFQFDLNGSFTVEDLNNLLLAQGYKVVSRLEDQDEPLKVKSFKGTLGDFLNTLAQVQNIAYEYRNGVLFITEASRYSVTLPQYPELLDQVAISLEEMGATDVRTDLLAGMVYYSAKPDISDYVQEHLDRISKNSAMVQLQIAVVTVGLNRGINQGFDWNSFGIQRGSRDFRPGVTGGVINTDKKGNQGNNSNEGGGLSEVAQSAAAIGSALTFSGGSGLGYVFNNDSFSLTAALKMLSNYGNARTEQNVVLGTISGMPVKISSGNDIPYVKSIGSSTSSGGSTSGSTNTEIIRSGLELEVVPNFDALDQSVVTAVKVNMSSLVAMRELSAGNNLGTLSQPEMQNLEFENIGRLRAGETVVVGGITYDQMSNNYTGLPGMEKLPLGSKTSTTTKHAMYIVIRPTVVVFTQDASKLNQSFKEKGQLPAIPALPKESTPSVQWNMKPLGEVKPPKAPEPEITLKMSKEKEDEATRKQALALLQGSIKNDADQPPGPGASEKEKQAYLDRQRSKGFIPLEALDAERESLRREIREEERQRVRMEMEYNPIVHFDPNSDNNPVKVFPPQSAPKAPVKPEDNAPSAPLKKIDGQKEKIAQTPPSAEAQKEPINMER